MGRPPEAEGGGAASRAGAGAPPEAGAGPAAGIGSPGPSGPGHGADPDSGSDPGPDSGSGPGPDPGSVLGPPGPMLGGPIPKTSRPPLEPLAPLTLTTPGPHPAHPRRVGRLQTAALAFGGSTLSLAVAGHILMVRGTAAVPLLAAGLLLAWMALPGWIELVCLWPARVGGIAAASAEAYRSYSPVLANLTGVCYWWGRVPFCGLTAVLAARAVHAWALPSVPVTALALALVGLATALNLSGLMWTCRVAVPVAAGVAVLAVLSALTPVAAGHVDWHHAFDFGLSTPFGGVLGKLTALTAGLFLVSTAAPAFEGAACHVGETRTPVRDVPRAMLIGALAATAFFVILPVVWLGTSGRAGLTGELATALGPTFAPLVGGAARGVAVLFVVLALFLGTVQPLAGASRTLAQLAEDGLVPRVLERRLPTDVPWVAIGFTAAGAAGFAALGAPIWLVAAGGLGYLIALCLSSVAVCLLRRDAPHLLRPYRATKAGLWLGMAAAAVWLVTTVLGLQQHGLPAVLTGLVMAYSGSALYLVRVLADRRRLGRRSSVRSMHVKLTGAVLLVLALDSSGYLLAVNHLHGADPALVAGLKDLFVAVALLTVTVGLILPGLTAHASGEVMRAARRLAAGTLRDLTDGLEALARADLAEAHARVETAHVAVHSRDEIGAMAESFNAMADEAARAAGALDVAREQLRLYTLHLGELVSRRTLAMERANADLELAQQDRGRLLEELVRTLEDQRTELAADLHDGPLQRLAAVSMRLERAALRARRGDMKEAAAQLETGQQELRDEIAALRRLMSGLRPPVLDENGLPAAIGDHVREFCGLAGLRSDLDLADVGGLERHTQTMLYRVVQESLTNVVRHAGADGVRVTLGPDATNGDVRLSIHDDGHGFDTAKIAGLVREGHFGLAGMRERVSLAGGTLTVESPAEGGTTIIVRVPRRTPETAEPAEPADTAETAETGGTP